MKTGRFLGSVAAILAAAALVGCGGGKVADDMLLVVTPSTVTFGTVAVGESSVKTLTLSHAGSSGVITLNSVELSAATSASFSIKGPDKTSLNPGETTFVYVTYAPLGDAQDAGTLVIKHNVPIQNYETDVQIKALTSGGNLVADPDPVDFGDVPGGQPKPLDVKIWNDGSKAVTITKIALHEGASGDYQILAVTTLTTSAEKPLPVVLNPRPSNTDTYDFVGLSMQYSPTGGGCDDSTLEVTLEGDTSPIEFVVHGCELGPKVVVAPGMLDFGCIKEGDKKTLPLTLTNTGNYDLDIAGVLPTSVNTDPNIVVDDAPAAGTKIAPNASIDVHVTWTAHVAEVKKFPQNQAIGGVEIDSNDPLSPTVIPVFGCVDSPEITLIPGDVVDFGVVGQGVKATRTLTIRNDGNGQLVVAADGITMDTSSDPVADEFVMIADPAFGPTNGSAEGHVEGYAAQPVTLSFTNKGGATGDVQIPLKVKSNCADKPEVTVILKATRAGTATCDPVLVPPTTDYGTIPYGFSKELKVNLKNKGSGYCSFGGAKISDCSSSPFGGGATCADPFKSGQSKTFVIPAGGLPPAVMNGIGPGMSVPISIKYQPTGSQSLFGELNKFYALLRVKALDANIPGQTPKEIIIPAASATGTFNANLIGSSGQAKIAILPGEVKFGLVTIGCYSKTYKVCVYNTGNAPLTISDIVMQNCSPEFKLKNVPGLPKAVSSGVPLCFETVYAPQDTSQDDCTVQVKSDDQGSSVVTVGLSGQGTYDSEQTDEFTQVSGQSVDILFIIDDSSSMCDKQDRMIAAYADFVNNADVWKNDYHIGLIDLNVLNNAIMGKLNRGNPNPPARYLTPQTPDGKTKYQSMANMDCTGDAPWAKGGMDNATDNQESGLEAAQLALSAPMTTETGIACNADTDCTGNKTLCGDPKTCPYYCIDKTCGGWNKGFVREDAQLECIVLSDEEDQSPSAVSFYIDFLKNIKGYYNTSMFHWHSIVGQSSGSSSCAQEGKRYNETSQQTNGLVGDICDTSFAPTMNSIGKIAFGLKVQFFLTRLADPPTVTVKVAGKQCSSGWKYDSTSNAVLFDSKNPGDACSQPQPGDLIQIHYKTLCLTS